ncbi:MAG: amidohydrolase family protein, partial [Chloroflexia bacterium]
ENLRFQLQQPWIKVSSDAGGFDPAWAVERGPIHPRAYGTYPRVLGKYVREEAVLPLEDAVRKMSSAVAARLGLRERGFLRSGYFADVVVFDPATVGDRATFDAPHQLNGRARRVGERRKVLAAAAQGPHGPVVLVRARGWATCRTTRRRGARWNAERRRTDQAPNHDACTRPGAIRSALPREC